MSSLYENLNIEKYEIRMLALSQNSISPTVECTMRTYTLVSDLPQYVALSYCWGDESITKDITVNGVTHAVTANLEEALQHLRRHTADRSMLWVDAICVGQKNSQERSYQVRLMKQIFEKAETAYAWLGGRGFEATMSGIQSVRAWNQASLGQHSTPTPEFDLDSTLVSACSELLQICQSPYWQRRWVIQELTVANNVQVMCLTDTLSLEILQSAYLSSSELEYWDLENKVEMGFFRLILEFRRKYLNGQSLLLAEAIFATQKYLSKDPRDKIYALIGICSDGAFLVPAPNYSQSLENVSRDLTRAFLRRNANLDIILSCHRRRNTSSSLPTWALDWCSPGLPQAICKIVNTSTSKPHTLVTSGLQIPAKTLRVQGVTLRTVVAMTSCLARTGSIPPDVATSPPMSSPSPRSCRQYYGTRRHVAFALAKCMLSHRQWNIHPLDWPLDIPTFEHIFLWKQGSKTHQSAELENNSPISIFSTWKEANKEFKIDGTSVSTLLNFYNLRIRDLTAVVLLTILLGLALTSVALLIRFRKSTIGTIIQSVAGPILLIAALALVPFLVRLHSTWPRLKQRFSESMGKPMRLFVLDQGIIGTAHGDIDVGDNVCLIAGCTMSAVLRKHEDPDTLQYSVVGRADAYLNSNDREKYKALLLDDGDIKNWHLKLHDLISGYQMQPWWESYHLI